MDRWVNRLCGAGQRASDARLSYKTTASHTVHNTWTSHCPDTGGTLT